MSDLVNLNRDSLYDNVKHAIFDKLEQDLQQLNALEEYILRKNNTFKIECLLLFTNLFNCHLD